MWGIRARVFHRVVAVGLMLTGCIRFGGDDGDRCSKARKACTESYEACEELFLACDGKDWQNAEEALIEACEDGRAESCDIMIRHYIDGELDNEFTPAIRRRAIEATCEVSPSSLCKMADFEKDDHGFYSPDLEEVEEVLDCDDPKVEACALNAAKAMLNQEGSSASSFGEETRKRLTKACAKSGGDECDAVYRYFARFGAGPLVEGTEAFLMASCKAGHKRHCTELAIICADDDADCDLNAVQKLLATRCSTPECMAAASSVLPGDFLLETCLSGQREVCREVGRGLEGDTLSQWQTRFEEGCDKSGEDDCLFEAAQLFIGASAWSRAAALLQKACPTSKGACEELPYAQTKLDRPKNQAGLHELETRCRMREDGRACYRLATIYKYGHGVFSNPETSRKHAERACAAAKAASNPPSWKDEAPGTHGTHLTHGATRSDRAAGQPTQSPA